MFVPESRGIIIIFESPISERASCIENKRDLPRFLYSPEKGASKPILSSLLFSFDNKFLSKGFSRGYKSYKNTTMLKRTYIMGNDAKFYKKTKK